MNKKAKIIIDTTVGQAESINVKEIVKQGSIFGPIMCYGKIDIGMLVYMEEIVAATGILEIRKGIRNCAKLEKEKKMRYGLKKTKYMMAKK